MSARAIVAKCRGCGAADFVAAPTRDAQHGDLLICVVCRTEVRHSELMIEIGKEAVRRAKAARLVNLAGGIPEAEDPSSSG